MGIHSGAYLVQGAGHCGTCHTPRAVTFQEKALDDSSTSFLAGGQRVGGWVAVNLRGNIGDGLGSWSKQDIVATLRTARNAQQAIIGPPMNEVVVHSTQYLNDADLQAIAAYLKTLAPSPGVHPRSRPIRRRRRRLPRVLSLIAARNSMTITAPPATVPMVQGA